MITVRLAGIPEPSTEPVLNRADQVLRLSPEQAARHLPVDLTGVVVAKLASHTLQVYDGEQSLSFYLNRKTNLAVELIPGRRVRILGVTDPGKFAPIVLGHAVEDLGEGEIPPAKPVALSQLDLVRYDGQWIEVNGVVRTAGSTFNREALLELASGNGRLFVHLHGVKPDSAAELVDAKIVVRGICLHYFNAKGQFYETRIFVPAGEARVIEKPSPADPFDLPLRTSASLLRYSFEGINPHRIHLSGQVTYVAPSQWFYMQDQTGGVLVRLAQTTPLKVGEEVDVVGFVSAEGLSPGLDDALFKRHKETTPIQPHSLKAVKANDSDGILVTLEGTLKGAIFGTGQCQLSVEADGVPFDVFLTNKQINEFIRALAVGSRLAVTGVCRVPMEPTILRRRPWMPTSFTLYARSSGDVRLIAAPSLKTTTLVPAVLFSGGGAALLGLGAWALRARKRLREQRRQRALAEAEFAAVLKERNRMAREIHDTVAQGLTSISVQVELAREALANGSTGGGVAGEHLSLARSFVRAGLSELRRTIRGLRPQILEDSDLVGALRKTGEQLVAGTGIDFRFEVAGDARRMPAYLEDDLLHLGQEAVTNAIRHASAKEIVLGLNFHPNGLHLYVRDNGCGFVHAVANGKRPEKGSGYGLLGMEERVRPYDGSVDITTSSGRGSQILVRIPNG